MCGRFEQSETPGYYARALGADTHGLEWQGGDSIPKYNVSPGSSPLMLHALGGALRPDYVTWGYRTPKEAEEKKRPWINARVEKALTGRYFQHMFQEGRVIIPGAGGSSGPLKMARNSLGISRGRTGCRFSWRGSRTSGRTSSGC